MHFPLKVTVRYVKECNVQLETNMMDWAFRRAQKIWDTAAPGWILQWIFFTHDGTQSKSQGALTTPWNGRKRICKSGIGTIPFLSESQMDNLIIFLCVRKIKTWLSTKGLFFFFSFLLFLKEWVPFHKEVFWPKREPCDLKIETQEVSIAILGIF